MKGARHSRKWASLCPDFDDAISQAEIDEPPAQPAVSIPIDGEWQDFHSVAAAEQAAYADFKAASHRDAQKFPHHR